MKQGTKMVVWGLGLGLSLLVMKIGFCIPNHFFGVAIILMICAGAFEMSMAQWASAFAESALGLTKSVGDLGGAVFVCDHNGNCPCAVRQIW